MMKASEELIRHHIQTHRNSCEVENPVGEFMSCSCDEGNFAVVVCMGCFEIIFNALVPEKDMRCRHALAFMEHIERNAPQNGTQDDT